MKRCTARSRRFCEGGDGFHYLVPRDGRLGGRMRGGNRCCVSLLGGHYSLCGERVRQPSVLRPSSGVHHLDLRLLDDPADTADFLVTCLRTAIPAAVTVWLNERFRIRSIVFFGLAGAVIGGASAYFLSGATSTQSPQLSPLFISAGLAAGLAYWSVAGRHAGPEQSSTPA